jgi:hypothetical protein
MKKYIKSYFDVLFVVGGPKKMHLGILLNNLNIIIFIKFNLGYIEKKEAEKIVLVIVLSYNPYKIRLVKFVLFFLIRVCIRCMAKMLATQQPKNK